MKFELEIVGVTFEGKNCPKYGKIQFQISGQRFELGGSYFEVKLSSPKASIGDFIFEKYFD